jgi:hypothetical protein
MAIFRSRERTYFCRAKNDAKTQGDGQRPAGRVRFVAASGFASPARPVRDRLELEVGHQKQVDDVDRIVRLGDEDSAPARNGHDEFAVADRNRATIGKMDDERLEWLRTLKVAKLLDGHCMAIRGT